MEVVEEEAGILLVVEMVVQAVERLAEMALIQAVLLLAVKDMLVVLQKITIVAVVAVVLVLSVQMVLTRVLVWLVAQV
jgi:hypothetical protein